MMDQLEDLNKKMEEIEEEEGSYDDEESDQDLDSELGDTLDVNDVNRQYVQYDKDREGDDSSPSNKKDGKKEESKKSNPVSESADEDD